MIVKKRMKYMYYLSTIVIFMLCTTAVRKYSFMFCFLGESSLNENCRQLHYTSLELTPEDPIDCPRIIRGDEEAINKALIDRVLVKKKQALITEERHLKLTKDCKIYKKIRKFITFPLSKEEEDYPIAYSMVVHNRIDMFERLLRAIYAPQNIYCVHVDDKSPAIFKETVRAITNCFDNVFVASKLEKVVYATWSRVQADLNCMEDLLNSTVRWKYLLNTCGTDFPLKTNAGIVKALKLLQGKNSMESEETPEAKIARWTYHFKVDKDIHKTDTKKSPPPGNVKMFSGNAYIVVTRDFVKSLFENPKVKNIIEWEKDTYSPDEHLWATLNRIPGVPGSVPSNKKYDTSDLNAIARLVKWEGHAGNVNEDALYSQCTGTYQRGICIYGVGDLPWLVQQHHLFANKFDSLVDNNAIQCLEQYLRQKALYGEEP